MGSTSKGIPLQGVLRPEGSSTPTPLGGSNGPALRGQVAWQEGEDLDFMAIFQAKQQHSATLAGLGPLESVSIESTTQTDTPKDLQERSGQNIPLPLPHTVGQSTNANGSGEGFSTSKDDLSTEDIDFLLKTFMGTVPPLWLNPMGMMNLQQTVQQFHWQQGSQNNTFTMLSEKMQDWIRQSAKTGRPIRVEIDPESSIILKIRQGRVSADFVTSNAALYLVLPQQLDELKQRLLAKKLPVDDLLARKDDESKGHRNPYGRSKSDTEEGPP